MLTIGLTGGIGTGKTSCARLFEMLGVPIYESDKEAKRLMGQDAQVRNELIEAFGAQTYNANGILDRSYLAQIVFSDQTQLQQINRIVHPAVRRDFIKWSNHHAEEPYIIQESALVYEIGLDQFYDKVIVVDAGQMVRIQRVMERDKVGKYAVEARMAKQLPQQIKVQKADFVITNDGSKSIIRQVVDIHMTLIELAERLVI